jgi:hypothetical protein
MRMGNEAVWRTVAGLRGLGSVRLKCDAFPFIFGESSERSEVSERENLVGVGERIFFGGN